MRDDVIQKEAERMVSQGQFDTVEDAWDEAEAVCEGGDYYD
jgi:hypothetical protein